MSRTSRSSSSVGRGKIRKGAVHPRRHTTVDAYIADAHAQVRVTARAVRGIVKRVAPDAEEGIAYGMPAYTWKAKPLFYFALMKGHLGLYPTPGPIKTCAHLLKAFSTSKGCVRVPYETPLPSDLIAALLDARKNEIEELRG